MCDCDGAYSDSWDVDDCDGEDEAASPCAVTNPGAERGGAGLSLALAALGLFLLQRKRR